MLTHIVMLKDKDSRFHLMLLLKPQFNQNALEMLNMELIPNSPVLTKEITTMFLFTQRPLQTERAEFQMLKLKKFKDQLSSRDLKLQSKDTTGTSVFNINHHQDLLDALNSMPHQLKTPTRNTTKKNSKLRELIKLLRTPDIAKDKLMFALNLLKILA